MLGRLPTSVVDTVKGRVAGTRGSSGGLAPEPLVPPSATETNAGDEAAFGLAYEYRLTRTASR